MTYQLSDLYNAFPGSLCPLRVVYIVQHLYLVKFVVVSYLHMDAIENRIKYRPILACIEYLIIKPQFSSIIQLNHAVSSKRLTLTMNGLAANKIRKEQN